MSGRRRDYLLFLEDMMAAIQKIEDYTGTLSRDSESMGSGLEDEKIFLTPSNADRGPYLGGVYQ
jgi:hypothetical protein